MPRPTTTDSVPRLRIIEHRLRVQNLSFRMPFRYGVASMEVAPILHLKVVVETPDGRAFTGVAADLLPPKWFDKDPSKSFQDNIADLTVAARIAGEVYRDTAYAPVTPFELWRQAYSRVMEIADESGLNYLTSQFGSSLYERAVIDAAGRSLGAGFHTLVRDNLLGIRAESVFSDLDCVQPCDAIPSHPPTSIFVRHTIGLGDALWERDLPEERRRINGLPVSVDAWIHESGIRYFKIKIGGDIEEDAARLEAVHTLLKKCVPGGYAATIDGNEQFDSVEALGTWWTSISQRASLLDFWPQVFYLEQPVDRARAFDIDPEGIKSLGPRFPPLLIDESDDSLERFREAIEAGYKGVSHKNCKGVFKSILNAMLIARRRGKAEPPLFLSGEDLTNQPLVPLQEDLCVASALGIRHLERNGHHYVGTLDHLSRSELQAALDTHHTLYEPHGSSGRLRIQNGSLNLTSLVGPGLGVGVETDFESLTPLEDWTFESLALR